MRQFIDRTGNKYGKLTVIRRVEDYVSPEGKKQIVWECRCDCGNTKNVTVNNLISGHTSSCGCAKNIPHKGFDLKDCLVSVNPYDLASICFDCKKSTGHCSWSEVDPITKKIRFELPEGCVTKECVRRKNHPKKGESKFEKGIQIISCPLFEKG